MLSDDIFRSKLEQTIASIRAWTGFIADVAQIEDSMAGDAWRISINPHMDTACPVELLLRDDQLFDIIVANETYEDRPIEALEDFLPLLEAIADGRVVTRRWFSAITGVAVRTETAVMLTGGKVWRDSNAPPPDPDRYETLERRDRHYVPFRLG